MIKRLLFALAVLFMLSVPALALSSANFWAIYDNENGYMQVIVKGSEIKVNFNVSKIKYECYGTIKGNRAVLYLEDEEDAKVTLTFGELEDGMIETITVKGNQEFGKILDGVYRAYHGHM